jgi:hypothetical protein
MTLFQVHVAVLECDTPIAIVKDKYGTYADLFRRLLNKSAQDLAVETSQVKIEVTAWDVVRSGSYPPSDQFDAILLTGSSK